MAGLETDAKRLAPPYMAFRTLLTALEILSQGLPSQLDRTVFPTFSGGVQNEVFGGFRFLELVDDQNRPTPRLEQLIATEGEARKALLRSTLSTAYADLLRSLDLSKATEPLLSAKLQELYGVSGSTTKKALRFLLTGLDFVGVPFSPYLGNRKVASNATGRRRRPATKRPLAPTDDVAPPAVSANAQGMSKTVVLASGGTLTVSATLNYFDLSGRDRDFVNRLIDMLQTYPEEDTA